MVLTLLLYVTTIIGVNCVDFHVVTHMFLIIITHYQGTHSAAGGSLTFFIYPLCCISSAPCYNCVFQHLARYIDVQQESPCPLAMLVICWVDICVVISAGGFASFSALPWQDQLNQCFHRIPFHTWFSNLATNFLKFWFNPKHLMQ